MKPTPTRESTAQRRVDGALPCATPESAERALGCGGWTPLSPAMATKWKYRAIYRVWSAEMSVTVGG